MQGSKKRSELHLGEGIFPMHFISSLENLDHDTAIAKCLEQIKNSSANDMNKNKARSVVLNSSNMIGLLLSITNFNLAHQGLSSL